MKLIDNNKLFNSYIQYIIFSKSFKSNKCKLFSLILSLKLLQILYNIYFFISKFKYSDFSFRFSNISLVFILLLIYLKNHELAKCIYSNNKPDDCKNINAKKKLKKVEDEINLTVAELYRIPKEELEGFRELRNIFFGLLCNYIF